MEEAPPFDCSTIGFNLIGTFLDMNFAFDPYEVPTFYKDPPQILIIGAPPIVILGELPFKRNEFPVPPPLEIVGAPPLLFVALVD